jgi:hypothetical protein
MAKLEEFLTESQRIEMGEKAVRTFEQYHSDIDFPDELVINSSEPKCPSTNIST